MKHAYKAQVIWKNDGSVFSKGKYSRAHTWSFDGGIEIRASASPSVVPPPYSLEDAVDPEEAFVAAVSSCHMLTFLYLASKQGLEINSYRDEAVGHMTLNAKGRPAVTEIILRPAIVFAGSTPTKELVDALHHTAHEECFIANSVLTTIKIEATS